jgi:hypothetical protein
MLDHQIQILTRNHFPNGDCPYTDTLGSGKCYAPSKLLRKNSAPHAGTCPLVVSQKGPFISRRWKAR